jgi:hypothetical protein
VGTRTNGRPALVQYSRADAGDFAIFTPHAGKNSAKAPPSLPGLAMAGQLLQDLQLDRLSARARLPAEKPMGPWYSAILVEPGFVLPLYANTQSRAAE